MFVRFVSLVITAIFVVPALLALKAKCLGEDCPMSAASDVEDNFDLFASRNWHCPFQTFRLSLGDCVGIRGLVHWMIISSE